MRRGSWVSGGAAAEPGRRGMGVAIACDGVARVWIAAPAFESSRVRPLKVETVLAAEAVSRSMSGWRRWVSEPCAPDAREACDVFAAPGAAGVLDVPVVPGAVGAVVWRENI